MKIKLAILCALSAILTGCGTPTYNVPVGETINGESPRDRFVRAVSGAGYSDDTLMLRFMHNDLCRAPELDTISARLTFIADQLGTAIGPQTYDVLATLDITGCS